MCKYVAYYRVSTKEQGTNGHGLDAQKAEVREYAARTGCEVIAEYEEAESGKLDSRPMLMAALNRAATSKATLIIAKLDRLSRNASFLMSLKTAGVDFRALDCPELTTLTLGILATIAQHERETISQRTKDGLAAARAKGKVLGVQKGNAPAAFRAAALKGSAKGALVVKAKAKEYALRLAATVAELKADDITGLQAITDALNGKGVLTRHGGQWHPTSVARLLARIRAAA